LSLLRSYLEANAILSSAQLEAATRHQQAQGGSLDTALLELGLLGPAELDLHLGRACGLPTVPARLLETGPTRPWGQVPRALLDIGWAMPLALEDGHVLVAVHPDLPDARLGQLYRQIRGFMPMVAPECCLAKLAAERSNAIVAPRFAMLVLDVLDALQARDAAPAAPTAEPAGAPDSAADPASSGSFAIAASLASHESGTFSASSSGSFPDLRSVGAHAPGTRHGPAEPPAAPATPAASPAPSASPAPVPTASPAPVPTASPAPVPTASPAPVPPTSPAPSASPAPVPTASPAAVPPAGPIVSAAPAVDVPRRVDPSSSLSAPVMQEPGRAEQLARRLAPARAVLAEARERDRITEALVRAAAQIAPRVALFGVRREGLRALATPGALSLPASLVIPIPEGSLLDRAVAGLIRLKLLTEPRLAAAVGRPLGIPCLFEPVFAQERGVLMLYIDRDGGLFDAADHTAVRELCDLAGTSLEALLRLRGVPGPRPADSSSAANPSGNTLVGPAPLSPAAAAAAAATASPAAPAPKDSPAATASPTAPAPKDNPAATASAVAPVPTDSPLTTASAAAPVPTDSPATTASAAAPVPTDSQTAASEPAPSAPRSQDDATAPAASQPEAAPADAAPVTQDRPGDASAPEVDVPQLRPARAARGAKRPIIALVNPLRSSRRDNRVDDAGPASGPEPRAATPAPADSPDTSSAPVPADSPDTSSAPVPADSPDTASAPVPTDSPDTASAPVPTDSPDTSSAPVPTDSPDTSIAHVPADSPDTASAPVPTDSPASAPVERRPDARPTAISGEILDREAPAKVSASSHSPAATPEPSGLHLPNLVAPPGARRGLGKRGDRARPSDPGLVMPNLRRPAASASAAAPPTLSMPTSLIAPTPLPGAQRRGSRTGQYPVPPRADEITLNMPRLVRSDAGAAPPAPATDLSPGTASPTPEHPLAGVTIPADLTRPPAPAAVDAGLAPAATEPAPADDASPAADASGTELSAETSATAAVIEAIAGAMTAAAQAAERDDPPVTEPAAPPVSPTLDTAASIDVDAVLEAYLNDPDDPDARAALTRLGPDGLARIAARFPGPIDLGDQADARSFPPPSAHGPLLRACVDIGPPITPHILELLEYPRPQLRFYAAFVFQELRDPRCMSALAEHTFDPDADVRLIATRVLESYSRVDGFLAATELVRAELRSRDRERALLAAEAAGTLRDTRAVYTLIELLSVRDKQVRETALEALCSITAKHLGYRPAKWRAWYDEHGQETRVEWVIEALRHRDAAVRRWAADELVRITGHRVTAPAGEKLTAKYLYQAWQDWWKSGSAGSARE